MLEAESLTALRQAATALIGTAAATTVLAALRMLIDGNEAAFAAPTPVPRSASPQPPPRVPARPDETWDVDRKRFRTAMLERNVGYPALAEIVGVSRNTLQNALGKRASPTHALRQKLEVWLADEPAPAVATPEQPFRGNGNGRDHTSEWRVDSGLHADSGSATNSR
jgi:hypothetical protein